MRSYSTRNDSHACWNTSLETPQKECGNKNAGLSIKRNESTGCTGRDGAQRFGEHAISFELLYEHVRKFDALKPSTGPVNQHHQHRAIYRRPFRTPDYGGLLPCGRTWHKLADLPRPAAAEHCNAGQPPLAEVGANDLSLAKVYEGHTDALAILAESRSDRSRNLAVLGDRNSTIYASNSLRANTEARRVLRNEGLVARGLGTGPISALMTAWDAG